MLKGIAITKNSLHELFSANKQKIFYDIVKNISGNRLSTSPVFAIVRQ